MATLDSKRPAPDGAIVPNAGAVGPQRIAIVSADLERGERLRRGFERSGAEVCLAERASDVAAAMPGADAVVVAHDDRGAILATLAALRAVSKVEAPVLVIGGGDDREAIMGLGVAAWIAGGGEIRDVVTAAALVASQQVRLETVSGIYYLARTLLAQRRTCMVTVSRGLRRGELAFVDGQLSSAAIGMLHGLSAFHQLLLWTRGTLEIRDEDVVPHGEIPLASEDLCDEAKRFLAEVRDAAGSVSPASVYEQCSERAREVLAPAPEPVVTVWRLFDGSRTVADVVEDSPYRMVETFRIAARLAEVGAIARHRGRGKRSRAQAILALEEWLTDSGEPVATSGPAAPAMWADLVPFATEPMAATSPVVPSASVSGEIQVASPEPEIQPQRDPTATLTLTPAPAAAPAPAPIPVPAPAPALANAPEPEIQPSAAAAAPAPMPEPEIQPPAAAAAVPEAIVEPEQSTPSVAEVAFFERGDEIERNPAPPVDTFEDLEPVPSADPPRRTLWSRLRPKPH